MAQTGGYWMDYSPTPLPSGAKAYINDPRPGFRESRPAIKARVPEFKQTEVIPWKEGDEPTPIEFYQPPADVRDTSKGKGFPYVDEVDPEVAARMGRDVAQITGSGIAGELTPDSLYHAHMMKKAYEDPRRRLPGNVAALAAGKAGTMADREPYSRRGAIYHTQEHRPIPRGTYHNALSWFDEPGIRFMGPAGYQSGIGPSPFPSEPSFAGMDYEMPQKWGWPEKKGVMGFLPGAQVHFRPEGAGYGDTWKKDYVAGTMQVDRDGKNVLEPNLKNYFLDPPFKSKEEFLDTVNRSFPRASGPWKY